MCGGWSSSLCLDSIEGHGRCEDCPYCCAFWPDRFNAMINEVEGLHLDDVRAAPLTVPEIPSQVVKLRDGDLDRRWSDSFGQRIVATTLEALIGRETAECSIRDQNHLDPSCMLLIDGCCKDVVLEANLWRRRWRPSLYGLFEMEAPCLLIAPDMSLYSVGMPPCHKLYQIKRTFLMYQHYQDNGLAAIPFVSFDAEAHVTHIARWLKLNPCVTHIAASFQTVHGSAYLWLRHFRLLEMLRDLVPRNLSWLLIGQSDNRQKSLEKRFGRIGSVVVGPKYGPMRKRDEAMQKLPLGCSA